MFLNTKNSNNTNVICLICSICVRIIYSFNSCDSCSYLIICVRLLHEVALATQLFLDILQGTDFGFGLFKVQTIGIV